VASIETEPCEILAWDSEFFGRTIGRLTRRTLTPQIIEDAGRWAEAHRIECIYFLGDSADPITLRLAHEHGFELTDVRVMLERSTTDRDVRRLSAVRVRPVDPKDVPALRTLASANHRDSRFYYDRHFPQLRCDELFATWIEKSACGYADHVLVASSGDTIAGYVTLHVRDRNRGSIGLFGVDAASRGTGVGSSLIAGALEWLRNRDVALVDVVTQARNIRGMRFYQHAGFSVTDIGLWYHWWSGR
jgi:dTDP-4-amino-4,6-dideoxy-D-galactose acyltransferase